MININYLTRLYSLNRWSSFLPFFTKSEPAEFIKQVEFLPSLKFNCHFGQIIIKPNYGRLGALSRLFANLWFLNSKFVTIIVLETVTENFRSLRWKLSPWHAFEVHLYISSAQWWLNAFVTGIINKWTCVNRVISYSLGGFEVFLKVPVIIIIRFGEKYVLGTIYIDIFQFWGYMVYLIFFVCYS